MFNIHGHDAAVRQLQRGLHQGGLFHAYLLTGPQHVGKTTLAMQMAQAVNCTEEAPPCGQCNACRRIALGQHADVRVVGIEASDDGEGRKFIGIAAIRALTQAAHLRPYEGRTRVFVIQDADLLSQEAANALLKTLEEPPPDTLLVLLTADFDSLLPTVVSRCQLIELRPLPITQVASLLQEHHNLPPDEADQLARFSRGCLGWANTAAQEASPLVELHQQLERIADVSQADLIVRFAYADGLARRFRRDRAAGREELYLWLRWWRDVLLVQQGRSNDMVHLSWRETLERLASQVSQAHLLAWLHQITASVEALDQNANPRLTLEVLMLELPVPAVMGQQA